MDDFLKTLINEYGKTKAIIILVLVVLLGISIKFDFSENNIELNPNIENSYSEVKSTKDECEEKLFWENSHEWEMPGLKVNVENKKVCGNSKKTYYTPATLITTIPITFNNYSFSYIIEYEDGKTAPHLIRLGDEFIDLYLHEGGPQIIGVSTLKLEEGKLTFSREPKPLELSAPPLDKSTVEVSIKYIENQVGVMIYSLSVKYYTNDNPIPITDPFTIKSFSNDPSQNSSIQVGFGTSKNECVRPESYKACR